MKYLLCFLLLISASSGQAATLLVLGDNLSAAYGMEAEKGWVNIFQKKCDNDCQIINGSVSGETTAGGLARLPALLREHRPDYVLIELGGNDGLRGYSIATMSKNLRKIIELSRKHQSKPLLFSMQIPANYGKRYTERFRQAYPKLAAQQQIPLIPFIFEDIMLQPEMVMQDGIHPTEAAQPLIAEKMMDQLLPILNGTQAADIQAK